MIQAVRCPGSLFGFRQGGQQQRRQNGNDRDDHQQFNQRERATTESLHWNDVRRTTARRHWNCKGNHCEPMNSQRGIDPGAKHLSRQREEVYATRGGGVGGCSNRSRANWEWTTILPEGRKPCPGSNGLLFKMKKSSLGWIGAGSCFCWDSLPF